MAVVGLTISLMVAAIVLLVSVASAVAAPQWLLDANANSVVAAGGSLNYHVQLANSGDDVADGASGEPIVFTGVLDPGVTLNRITMTYGPLGTFDVSLLGWVCTGDGPGAAPRLIGAHSFSCVIARQMNPHSSGLSGLPAQPTVVADVAGGASGQLESSFTLSGAGASQVETSEVTRVSSVAPGFGVSAFDGAVTAGPSGAAFSQAAGHPFAASTSIEFNTGSSPNSLIGDLWPVAAPKTLEVNLPPGFIGYPAAAAKCTSGELSVSDKPVCPTTSQVGTTVVYANGQGQSDAVIGPFPVFNMEPPPDVPARFGFNIYGSIVVLDAELRPNDYGVTIVARSLPEGLAFSSTTVTLWGVPSDDIHTSERGCAGSSAPVYLSARGPTCPSGAARLPLLRNPTSCTAPGTGLVGSMRVDSWAEPGNFVTASFVSHEQPGYPRAQANWGPELGTTGCGDVPFDPTFRATPGVPVHAGEPNAFAVDFSMPQVLDPDGISQSDVRKMVVMLPEGVRINPSAAAGLGACSPQQIGLHTMDEPSCPNASKIGALTVETPLLSEPLSGSVYLATPHENPFGSLLAVYFVVRGPGVIVKLPGLVTTDPVTGRLSVTVDDFPQLPFSHLHVQLSDGPRAQLALPSQCGAYTSQAVLTGWSGKTVNLDSRFDVSEGPEGGACQAGSFAPTLTAGTVNPVAGAFAPLVLRLQRSDADSEFNALSLNLPPGLLADLSSVPVRCNDAQATAAACPVDSHIGTVTVGAGAGSNPYYVNGDVYLTGPYNGGPFGIAVIVHAQAGPVDLGYVVVRGSLRVHSDGSATTVTDPFPAILQGIPLQVRDVRVNIDRPHFILNPTNCSTMSIGGTVSSTGGQTAPLASRFQVGECAALGFHPSFKVSTQAKTSKAQGASLDVRVTSGGGQANLAKTIVTLPKQLPARLTTIQQACLAAVFAANPASCPVGSNIGIATARTPILASPVTGPAYLVSHGGAAFPDVVLILQGEGVTVNVIGGVNIKGGITTSSFNAIPDVPISTFELKLPTGPHSALGSNLPAKVKGNLCGQNLTMPTLMAGQNGAQVKQNTMITVTGCPRAKKKATPKAKKHTRRAHGKAKKSSRKGR